MASVNVGSRAIGDGKPCYIVAEIGDNHAGNLELAKEMISAAKRSGADAVKFQAYKADKLVSRANRKAFEIFKKSELSEAQFAELQKFALAQGIDFFASAFDAESADMLSRLNVPCFKVGSSEMTNEPLLKHIAKKGKPMMLATGFASVAEVKEALDAVYSAGNRQVVLLHCVAKYPAPVADLNLARIGLLKKRFNVPVGFSDHSLGYEAAVLSVALGACVIEKHFTIDKSLPGPDQSMSIDEKELKEMVAAVREAEKALGSKIEGHIEPKENIIAARKGLFALRDIKQGEKISFGNVVARRPCTGIAAKDLEKAIGMKAKAAIKKDEALSWNKLSK